MADQDDILAELRAVFRDEVDDHIANLERAALVFAREGAAPADRDEAAAEVFRAVHSLKGAARAVAFGSLERFLHAVEADLGATRQPGGGHGRAAADTEVTLRALRACARSLAERGEPDEAALAEARRSLGRAGVAGVTVAEPPPPAPAESAAPLVEAASETQRVSVARLVGLLGAAEELSSLVGRQGDQARQLDALEQQVLDLRTELRRARQETRASREEDDVAAHALDRGLDALHAIAAQVRHLQTREDRSRALLTGAAGELLSRSRDLRVLPLASLAPLLERAALDAAAALGRRVEFVVEGDRPEVDRRVLEGLREPLLHLVRNAVDHGLEDPEARAALGKEPAGRVSLRVALAGRDVRVSIVDDGRGIDPEAVLAAARARGLDVSLVRAPHEALSLLFEAGFSTRDRVTTLSGRGVGLDVVRSRVAQMHGRVEVESEPGRGSRFSLVVPVDLSVMRGVVVQAGEHRAVIVSTAVAALRRVAPSELRAIEGRLYLDDEGALVPLSDLDVTLGIAAPAAARPADGRSPCVVLAVGGRRAALRVDALLEEREVVVRPLNARVRRAAFVAGATVLGDGEVVLVLDAADLAHAARPASAAGPAEEAPASRRRVLVVDDSVTTRQLERTILEAAGYEVAVAPDGQAAWEQLASAARFDAVVSDIEMPRMDGFQLLSRVRSTSRLAGLPVILVTALSQASDRQRALDLGASAYVVKSRFDQDELLDTLQQLL